MCPHAALLQRLLIAILALAMPLVASGPVRAEDNGATARGMFTMLPTSIFETTAEGLSEADKQRLLAEGRTEFWEIAGETSDVLVFASLPFRDRAVGLRLFHNTADGSTEVAVGTLGEPICTVELWRLDASGRVVPIDTPQEPDAREFLGKGEKLPGNVTPTVLICLGLGGLKAVPVFWSSKGQVDVPLRNDVSFQWTGKGFEKRVTPREAGSR
ncbi:hypothetical protein [uncultured Desulfovibrio sp.]|uniref:hypothetical protein n=1 Tax=uncultured Desulfovibrio sp. TaxID=167968 RepID=UPI0025D5C424|nr:hypothetical protein [uncultured Desulfovibrio sp.]